MSELDIREGNSDQTFVTIADNQIIAHITGPHNSNLKRLETLLEIEVNQRGNLLIVNGPRAGRATAAQVLQSMLKHILDGENLTEQDVEGMVRTRIPSNPDQVNGSRHFSNSTGDEVIFRTSKKRVQARSAGQTFMMRSIESNTLAFALGPAGTGKTYLAVAYAVRELEANNVSRIILCRPAVEAGERLGFLPGDMKEKVDPYLRPIYDALYDLMSAERCEKLIAAGVIEIAPLAFMRGRTLSHSVVILDEAQNCSAMQLKMFLTRIGPGSKMIVCGDPTQVDLPYPQESGLINTVDLLKFINQICVVQFNSSDIVRTELVEKIVKAYENAGQYKPELPRKK